MTDRISEYFPKQNVDLADMYTTFTHRRVVYHNQIKENVFVFLFLELVFPISIYRKHTHEIQNVGSKFDMEHVVFDITEEVLNP